MSRSAPCVERAPPRGDLARAVARARPLLPTDISGRVRRLTSCPSGSRARRHARRPVSSAALRASSASATAKGAAVPASSCGSCASSHALVSRVAPQALSHLLFHDFHHPLAKSLAPARAQPAAPLKIAEMPVERVDHDRRCPPPSRRPSASTGGVQSRRPPRRAAALPRGVSRGIHACLELAPRGGRARSCTRCPSRAGRASVPFRCACDRRRDGPPCSRRRRRRSP